MADCALCGGTSDDNDIINLTCSECFEIFGHAPNGDVGDMSEKLVAAADSITISPTSKTIFDTTLNGLAGTDFVIIHPAAPTRTNGSGVYTRTSDTQVSITEDGIHQVNISFSQADSDSYDLLINGTIWICSAGAGTNAESEAVFSFVYTFTALDEIRVQKTSGAGNTTSNTHLSVVRLSG